jgi:hypothetical protein
MVDGAPLSFVITVLYFDEASQITWTDDSGVDHTYDIPENSVKFNIALSGAWPWAADANGLLLTLDVLWPSGQAPNVTATDSLVSVDVSSDSLQASLSFPTGSASPLVVDGQFQEATVGATVQGSHVMVTIGIPHFSESVVYDPNLVMSSNSATDSSSSGNSSFQSLSLTSFLALYILPFCFLAF